MCSKTMYSKPSLIRSQLSRIEIWKMKKLCSQLSTALKDIWNLGTRGIRARGLSDCILGSYRDWNHARRHQRLASAGWRSSNSASDRGKIAAVIFFTSALLDIMKFVFYDSFCLSPLIRISEVLQYWRMWISKDSKVYVSLCLIN
jgi:hypothetical protein